MSLATVYSTAQFGLGDDSSATGLFVGTMSWSGSSEQALAPNHIGCDVGVAIFNAKKSVSVDGIVAAKGTGLADTIGSAITLTNTTFNARTRNSEGLGDTATANAGLIVIGNTISPTATGFETGGMEMIYLPNVATNSPTTLT